MTFLPGYLIELLVQGMGSPWFIVGLPLVTAWGIKRRFPEPYNGYPVVILGATAVFASTLSVSVNLQSLLPLQSKIKVWSGNIRMGYEKYDLKGHDIAVYVTTHNDRKILITKPTEPGTILKLVAPIPICHRRQELFNQLSAEEQKKILHVLQLDLVKMGMEFEGVEPALTVITIADIIPASNLTEHEFFDRLHSMDAAGELVLHTVDQAANR